MDIGHFDFEKLTVFQKAKQFYSLTRKIGFGRSTEDKVIARQLIRAALSITLNIAEGSGRTSLKDRRNFFIIARGSAFECAAIILSLPSDHSAKDWQFQEHYKLILEVTKMLSTMIKNLDSKILK
jgi:four helix bundle protein